MIAVHPALLSGYNPRCLGRPVKAGYEVILFFLLTFAVTWTAWLAPAALGVPATSFWFGPGGPLFLLGVFAPGLVAIALTACRSRSTGVRALLHGIRRWDVGARWYLFALSYMVAIKLGAAVIHRAWSGAWPAFGETPLLLMLLATIPSTAVQAGEEVGWRGYVLPRLAARLGLGVASLLLGVIWALWHLPLFFLAGTGSDGQSFPVYLLHVCAFSVAIGWVYWKTGGSLLLVMLLHAAINNTSGLVPGTPPGGDDPFAWNASVVTWASMAIAWIVALVLLRDMRGTQRAVSPETLATSLPGAGAPRTRAH